ncbi:unnamed protein product [Chondrus crispus]|uniref:Uncharacterized protein n=1 Tax=Chondrus crispus TaxID=2769 RepID=R7QMD6_CHOCR|nr:unnamed protein product [Chondrus crispus]CDF39264.1 unnamed protein product [Chondrus crispus]|eukprot:XP_005719175.1 unnamed protein product [Chondrus crispus]
MFLQARTIQPTTRRPAFSPVSSLLAPHCWSSLLSRSDRPIPHGKRPRFPDVPCLNLFNLHTEVRSKHTFTPSVCNALTLRRSKHTFTAERERVEHHAHVGTQRHGGSQAFHTPSPPDVDAPPTAPHPPHPALLITPYAPSYAHPLPKLRPQCRTPPPSHRPRRLQPRTWKPGSAQAHAGLLRAARYATFPPPCAPSSRASATTQTRRERPQTSTWTRPASPRTSMPKKPPSPINPPKTASCTNRAPCGNAFS